MLSQDKLDSLDDAEPETHIYQTQVCGGSIHPAKPRGSWRDVWQSKILLSWGRACQTDFKKKKTTKQHIKSLHSLKTKKQQQNTCSQTHQF